jgi:hypothetical protein
MGFATYLIHTLLQKRFLLAPREIPRLHMLFFQYQYYDRVLRRTATSHPVTLNKLMTKNSGAVLQILQKLSTLSTLQPRDHLRRRSCHERRQRSGEGKSRTV